MQLKESYSHIENPFILKSNYRTLKLPSLKNTPSSGFPGTRPP